MSKGNKKKSSKRKLPKFINENQFIKMVSQINTNCATGARNYAMLMIMFKAGLRNSEVANLALPDMDFDTEMIYIQGGKGKKDRYVPMDIDIIKSAKHWLKFRPKSKFFFCTHKGGILDTRYIREMSYRVSEQAGVYIQDGRKKKKVNPHALRHGCLTSLLKEGFTIREVQEIAGHADISTTQIYTHVVLDEIAAKFSKREGLMIKE